MKQQILDHFNHDFKPFFEKYLPGLKPAGNGQLKALCPYHNDQNPSLSIDSKNGRYFCHGCGKKGDPFHFYGKINSLDTRRDFGKILHGIASDFGIAVDPKPKARVVESYDYRDEAGNLLFQVCRMEPKDFRQRRPDGKGWKWDLKGVEPVLYRLPEVLKSNEVIVVEGEKDADALYALGFAGTTAPMGARKWKDEYSETLAGKCIVLIPDNDLEGREHMTRVAQSLNGQVKSIKWLDLPDLPAKGDISDFIATFQDKEIAAERLSMMIENANPYQPPKNRTIDDLVMTVDSFCRLDIPERKTFLSPWLRENSIILVSGWRGVGKTFFALGLLDAVSRGQSFGPWKCEKDASCLFLDGEMSTDDDLGRIKQLNLNPEIFIYSDHLSNLWGLPRANLVSEKWRSDMKRILTIRKIKLWVLDNLASLAGGLDENSKKDWDPVNQWLLELRFAGISTVMLHHMNKEGGQRGTSAREDNLDISITLKQPSDYIAEDGCRFICHFSKARVQTTDSNSIGDTEFQLTQNEHGEHVWTWANVKQEKRMMAIQMLGEGCDQKAIASALGISKGYTSKIRKWAISEGYLTTKGNLTQTGFSYCQSMES